MPRALIVDDVPENRYLMEALLTARGYEVRSAANGADALAAARQEPPDIVIADIMMPVMDGFSLCREWKQDERLKGIPFVVYTATYTDERDRKLALALGADLFLVKPIEPEVFLREIETVLANHTAGRLAPAGELSLSDREYLEAYAHTLVRKLEKKVQQLEEVNRTLADREAFLHAVLEAVGSYLLVFGPDGTLVMANRAWDVGADSVTPASGPADATPRRIADTLRSRHRGQGPGGCHEGDACGTCALESALDRALAGESVGDLEVELDVAGGNGLFRRWVVANLEPVTIGGARHAVVALRDVTRRKLVEIDREQLQEQLLQAQRLEAVGHLAGGVAHDFNNILQALLSLTTLLRLRASTPELAKTASEVESLVKRGATLTQQLLVFARQRAAQRQRLELGEVIAGAGALLRRLVPERIALRIDTGPGLMWTDGDAGQLQQVLMNLVVNAKDAIPGEGEISVRTEAAGGEVAFEVRDTGQGMDAATQARIFDPFFTTKEGGKGTGLGLSVARRIVEEHGGRIEVASEPGAGSRFRVVLKASPPPERLAREQGLARELPPGKGRALLVVEDEEFARAALVKLLEIHGYQVMAAASGEEALALPPSPTPAVLLTDLVLPGISGPQLAEQLQQRWPHLAVILMSGYIGDEAVQRWLATQPLRFLEKPFDVGELAAHLRAVLGEPDP